MTRTDDARVADLVARLGDPDMTDLFRRLVQQGMKNLIDAEVQLATAVLIIGRLIDHRGRWSPRNERLPAQDLHE